MAFEDDLFALERRILTDTAGDFLAAVAELRAMLAAGTSGLERRLIGLAIPELERAAKTGVLEGFTLGADWALDSLPQVGKAVEKRARNAVASAPLGLVAPLTGIDLLLVKAKRSALLALRTGGTIDEALAPIFGAATTVRSTIETQVNAASNTASLLVGDAAGVDMVWEAERDACVYCLALAGDVVKSGDPFPAADRYADPPKSQGAVDAPPLHPHCRCRLAVLTHPSYAESLQREAQRSILRGFSLQSESHAVRVRAAARLLEADPVAPKSVKAYAAAAVKAGRFPTRDVPDGDPRLQVG